MDWNQFLPGECSQRRRIIPYLELMWRDESRARPLPLSPVSCGQVYKVENVQDVDNIRGNIEAHVVLMMKHSVSSGNVEWVRARRLMNDLGHVVEGLTWFKTLSHDEQLKLCRSVLRGLAWAIHQRYMEGSSSLEEMEDVFSASVTGSGLKATAEAVDATAVLELRELFYVATGSMTPYDVHVGHCVVHGSSECGVCNDEQRTEEEACSCVVD